MIRGVARWGAIGAAALGSKVKGVEKLGSKMNILSEKDLFSLLSKF